MKVRDVMSTDPVCCLPTDTAQKVARILCDNNIGSLPVVTDQQSRELIGMITDRDLCCSVLADGLDPKSTSVGHFVTPEPVTCRDGENLEKCERAMQEHQVRRIPIVDGQNRVIGIVSQADLARKDQPEKVWKTVAEISKPEQEAPSIAA
jgi:CBS domain-containing protein